MELGAAAPACFGFQANELIGVGEATSDYPRCFAGGCPPTGSPARTVTNSYSQGFLTGVNGYASIGYHKNGLVASVTHVNGVTVTTANDPVLIRRPASIQIAGPGWSQSTGTYAYDGAGNIKAIGPNSFAYDGASRLVSAEMGIGGQTNTQDYHMDGFGNIQAVTTNDLARRMIPTSLTTDRISGFGAAYDAAGNLTAWGGSDSYEYDRLNMTTRRTTGEEDWLFAYTADDQRIWSYRLAGGGSFFTPRDLGGKVLRRFESHTSWGTFTDSIYRGGELLATVDQANTVTHFHVDHLGTPRILTNSLGQDIQYYTYYPFGEELFPANDTQPFRFTGHERDLLNTAGGADDHDHMRARDTRVILGKFLSTDLILGSPHAPQSWNRYAYVMGNPLKYTDPYGLTASCSQVSSAVHCQDQTTVVAAAPNQWSHTIPGWLTNLLLHEHIQETAQAVRFVSTVVVLDLTRQLAFGDDRLGGPNFVLGMVAGGGPSKAAGAFTELSHVTAAGSRFANIATNLTAREFQANLLSSGYRVLRQTTGSNGGVTILSNGEKTYTIYTATSTGSASAQVTSATGEILSKIRLGGS